MPIVPSNFPGGMSDKEISNEIQRLSKDLPNLASGSLLNVASMINLGQGELQKRILEKSAKESSRQANIAIGIAVFSVILSFIAIYFSYQAFKIDEHWESAQTDLLKQINENLLKIKR